MHRFSFWILLLSLFCTACGTDLPEEVKAAYVTLPDKIDFNLHVRPILSDRCFACHGPDKNTLKADLELFHEKGAFKALASGNGYAFVAGKPSKSLALQRMINQNLEEVMPPPESNLSLNPKEIATIAKWIEQGAEWKDHWAFIPPKIQEPPQIETAWPVNNPIDQFVYQKLQTENIQPEQRASKERLLRRVTRDLIGLPPTIEELDAFLEDTAIDAYEKVVDRLLASDAFGERMALEWMDVARYADSHGLHADGWRMMWPWRDWVINAFNQNMPYDQFVTWQLAGDLMPNASKEQILATAFHRNHAMTAEGGVIDEEFRMEYVFDRTNTTATAFLGLTMECARCHDHKFDPFSQEEYFEMAAFFNNVKELGMTGDDGNYGPLLLLTDDSTDQILAKLQERILKKEKAFQKTKTEIQATANFISNLKVSKPDASFSIETLKPGKDKSIFGWEMDGAWLDGSTTGFVTEGVRLVDDRDGKVMEFDDGFDEFFIKDVGVFNSTESYTGALWVNTSKQDSAKMQYLMGTTGDKNSFWRGWEFSLNDQNQLDVRLIHALPHNYIHLRSETNIPLNEWTHVAFTYDGSGKAKGIRLFINGKEQSGIVEFDNLYKNILPINAGAHDLSNRPVKLGKSYRGSTGEFGIFEGRIDEVAIFKKELSPYEIAVIAGAKVSEQIRLDHLSRETKLYQGFQKELKELRDQRLAILDTIPEVMVMEEMPEPRTTYLLNRGQYDMPAYEVSHGTPEKVLAFSSDLPRNRLGLAQWLFSENHPLTARVTVNRYWQLFFGNGLVRTPQDFGSQGNLPTYPELLDWLALEFQNSDWNLKALCKTIVMSATYQQSSRGSKEKTELDPDNDLLSKGPSYRLAAELIRDNALATSGLLVSKIGGESVKPYQPEGLWYDLGNFSHKLLHYKPDEGDKHYRKSMYTFIRRTSPPPNMTTFDASNRDICIVKREITNTPLQALVLLNDPQFVEASKVFAERIINEGGDQLHDQLTFAFRLATSRAPEKTKLKILTDLYHKEVSRFEMDDKAVDELLNVGQYKIDSSLDRKQVAAMTTVANTLLNFDEAYMKR